MKRASAIAALCLLGGCAGTGVDPNAERVVVERSADRTTWSTPEALAAGANPRPRRAGPESRVVAAKPAPPPPARAAAEPPAAAPVPPSGRLVYFDFDRAEVKDEFRALLEAHAKALAAAPSRQQAIEGHADERGSAEYNLALGQRRAESVLKLLLLFGAGDGQLEAVSFGDTRPAAEGHDESAWSQNRRAELVDR